MNRVGKYHIVHVIILYLMQHIFSTKHICVLHQILISLCQCMRGVAGIEAGSYQNDKLIITGMVYYDTFTIG